MNYFFQILFAICIFPCCLTAQNLDFFELPTYSTQKVSVVKIVPQGDGFRAFVTSQQEVTNLGEAPVMINILEVLDYNSQGQSKTVGNHILANRAFKGYGGQTFKKGRKSYGTDKDVMNYEALQELYPELSDVDHLDTDNKKMPETYYASQLTTSTFKSKVKGFSSYKMSSDATTNPAKNKKKKRGLMNKLADVSNKLDNKKGEMGGKQKTYQAIDEVQLDWEDDYSGGQDKKNFWRNLTYMSSMTTGNVLAVNARKEKSDDMHEQMNREIVVFGPTGELINRQEWNTETPWNHMKSNVKYSAAEDNAWDIDFLVCVAKQNTRKKQNPDGDKKQLNVCAIGAAGSILYNHTYDLPEEYSSLDTIIASDGQKTIVIGTMKNNDKFVLDSTKDNQVMRSASTEGEFSGYLSTKAGDFIVNEKTDFRTKQTSEYYLYPVMESTIGEPMVIEAGLKDKTGSRLDLLVNDDSKVIIQVKEAAKGINGFKRTELTLPTLYELNNGELKRITSFEENGLVANPIETQSNTSVFSTNDGYYFAGKKFRLNDKGDNVITNAIIKLSY